MLQKLSLLLAVGFVSLSIQLYADATLKGTLDLNVEQARKVDMIQAKYRPVFASKRQDHNQEARKLRRARIANDSQQIARQEKIVERLHGELKQIRMNEDDEIRRVLSPAQLSKFEEYLKLRKEMVGSSRDAKDF
jgi:Spy/CpxP family protein refolding chaperone